MFLCYLCSKSKLVSFGNIIETSTFEELGRSFRYNKNDNGSTNITETSTFEDSSHIAKIITIQVLSLAALRT